MSKNSWDTTLSMVTFAFIPLMIIIIAIVGWLGLGVIWIAALFITIVTIETGGFIIIPVEWIFLLSDWILMWLGSFIMGYFTQDHFFNWMNNIYLAVGLIVIGVLMDTSGYTINDTSTANTKRSNTSQKKETSKQERRASGTAMHSSTSHYSTNQSSDNRNRQYSSGQRRSRARRDSSNPIPGKPVGLLDAMRGGMELQAYLPPDVSTKMQKQLKYVFEIPKNFDSPEGMKLLNTMMQLQMNFEVLQQNWNKAKNAEMRYVTETQINKLTPGAGQTVDYDPELIGYIHQAMLRNLEQVDLLMEKKFVDLEHPALAWIELSPILQKLSNGKFAHVILEGQPLQEFLAAMYNNQFPLRYHHTIKDMHSDNMEDVLSDDYRCEAIPLVIASIEFVEFDIWFNIKTVDGLRIEFQDKPTAVPLTPKAIIIDSFAKIGSRQDQIRGEDVEIAIGLLQEFVVNPQSQNIKIHFLMELLENHLRQQYLGQ